MKSKASNCWIFQKKNLDPLPASAHHPACRHGHREHNDENDVFAGKLNASKDAAASPVYFSVVHLDEFGVDATAAKLHMLDLGGSGGISDVWWQRWGHGPGGV
jgi:hypothetical protein